MAATENYLYDIFYISSTLNLYNVDSFYSEYVVKILSDILFNQHLGVVVKQLIWINLVTSRLNYSHKYLISNLDI